MKYCYECGRVTAGKPIFCNFCGRSYDVKLCPRLHQNPRIAEVCSQCGSRDFSLPQPKVSVWWKVLEWIARFALGVFFVCLFLAVLIGLMNSREGQSALILLGLLFAVLSWVWGKLPEWFRKLVRKSFEGRKRGRGRED